jgi:hypothetical protein
MLAYSSSSCSSASADCAHQRSWLMTSTLPAKLTMASSRHLRPPPAHTTGEDAQAAVAQVQHLACLCFRLRLWHQHIMRAVSKTDRLAASTLTQPPSSIHSCTCRPHPSPQCVHVQVIRGLIQQQQVAALLQHTRQLQPVALTTCAPDQQATSSRCWPSASR